MALGGDRQAAALLQAGTLGVALGLVLKARKATAAPHRLSERIAIPGANA